MQAVLLLAASWAWTLSARARARAQGEEDVDVTRDDSASIVGGADAAITDFPWQVSLWGNFGQFCGGSIISRRIVLTAQHCVRGLNPEDLWVTAGVDYLYDTGPSRQEIPVALIAVYPGYVDIEFGRDVALIYLAGNLDLSTPTARPIPLVTTADVAAGRTDAGVVATVSGWGSLFGGGPGSSVLQAVALPIVTNREAQHLFGFRITSDQLAAGNTVSGGVGICQGDSGGPLVVPDGAGHGGVLLAGVPSWVTACGTTHPGMFARVSSFVSWIDHAVAALGMAARPISVLNVTVPSTKTGSWKRYVVQVPRGAHRLRIETDGSDGDADLFVRHERTPSQKMYDCARFKTGSKESCDIALPMSGTWHIGILAFSSHSGTTLSVSYDLVNTMEQTKTVGGQHVARGVWRDYAILDVVPNTTLTVAMAVVTAGNPDLYIGWNNKPSMTMFSCRPYLDAGRDEVCSMSVPGHATRAFVRVHGRSSAVATYNLRFEWTAPVPTFPFQRKTISNLHVAAAEMKQFGPFMVTPGMEFGVLLRRTKGNPDLYVRFGGNPGLERYDCRPFLSGHEHCSLMVPEGVRTAHVMVRGSSSTASVFDLELSSS